MDFNDAIATCLTLIEERELQNESTGRPHSENVIARRLLASRDQLADAFSEVYFELRSEAHLRTFFGLVMSAAAPWGQGLKASFVAERAELIEINLRIAEAADALAQLLDRREEFRGKPGGFSDNTVSTVPDLVCDAAHEPNLFRLHLDESLDALRSRWPTLGDLMRSLATDAEAAQGPKETGLAEPVALGMSGTVARFFEILFRSLDLAMGNPATMPDDFNLSDATLAALANSALDLLPEDRLRATEVRDLRPAHWRLDGVRFDQSQP